VITLGVVARVLFISLAQVIGGSIIGGIVSGRRGRTSLVARVIYIGLAVTISSYGFRAAMRLGWWAMGVVAVVFLFSLFIGWRNASLTNRS